MGLVSVAFAGENSGTFSGRKSFPFRNLVLLVVDCGNEECSFVSEMKFEGMIKAVPVDTLDIKIANKDFQVTNKGAGNNQLRVNGKLCNVDAQKEHLLIGPAGTLRAEEGEIHPSVQFLLNATNTP
jgi:hypothetical protein